LGLGDSGDGAKRIFGGSEEEESPATMNFPEVEELKKWRGPRKKENVPMTPREFRAKGLPQVSFTPEYEELQRTLEKSPEYLVSPQPLETPAHLSPTRFWKNPMGFIADLPEDYRVTEKKAASDRDKIITARSSGGNLFEVRISGDNNQVYLLASKYKRDGDRYHYFERRSQLPGDDDPFSSLTAVSRDFLSGRQWEGPRKELPQRMRDFLGSNPQPYVAPADFLEPFNPAKPPVGLNVDVASDEATGQWIATATTPDKESPFGTFIQQNWQAPFPGSQRAMVGPHSEYDLKVGEDEDFRMFHSMRVTDGSPTIEVLSGLDMTLRPKKVSVQPSATWMEELIVNSTGPVSLDDDELSQEG
jgi:hypothetical protein